jgi:hypothetical protein
MAARAARICFVDAAFAGCAGEPGGLRGGGDAGVGVIARGTSVSGIPALGVGSGAGWTVSWPVA